MSEPLTTQHNDSIAAIGEKQLIRNIRAWLGDATPSAPQGIGDDAAVLPPTGCGNMLVTTDSVILDKHFLASDAAEQVGRKLVNRNASDIAAMGGTPLYAVIACMLPAATSCQWLEQFYLGVRSAALECGCAIVGGDCAQSESELICNLTMIGQAERPLLRTGGRCGDRIGVTGPLGGSFPVRHLTFQPRLQQGHILAAEQGVHAAMDISDGIASDLPHLLPPGTSAALDLSAIPLHPDAFAAADASGKPPLVHAMCDGEDHELLFLADPLRWDAICTAFLQAGLPPPVAIGHVRPAGSAALLDHDGQPLPPELIRGDHHFSSSDD
jgi:thiamine-monophosphate kinase